MLCNKRGGDKMYDKKVLGLEEAEVAVRAIIEEASKDPSRPMAIAVVDDRGDIISFVRMDGARPLNSEMATKKAYTSAFMRLDTRKWLERRQKEDYGKYEPVGADRTLVAGGLAIIKPDEAVVYGGIGTSGRKPNEDEDLAFVGLKALQNFLWPSH
jgi:uncharacterized protein GlcG (DUF336 family)